ncbi:MAG TPA: LxmA leader domain family RiPP [Streptosporangiaceae bacterium]|nr:LxmA leader domain family RiPP [Streptosporangiaceae bacterium]
MTAEQLAAGFDAYVSADELAREAAVPEDAAVREPTTSIATTVCIISYHCGNKDTD